MYIFPKLQASSTTCTNFGPKRAESIKYLRQKIFTFTLCKQEMPGRHLGTDV